MQTQQKKIKGFTLLELLVVVIIIGSISAIGFLPFKNWRSDRLARAGAVAVSSVIQDIYSQVQRGHYSFAQFRVHSEGEGDDETWFISSYGMETKNFTTLMRNKYDSSNNLTEFHVFGERCKTNLQYEGKIMWDDQGYPITSADKASKKLTVSSYEIDDKLSLGVPGNELAEGTICFSKDGSYYAAYGMFLGNSFGGDDKFGGGDESGIIGEFKIIEELYICQAEDGAESCSLSTGQENFYSIKWSRFGNIDMQKLN